MHAHPKSPHAVSGPENWTGESLAQPLSGLNAARQRDQAPDGVMVALRSVQHLQVTRGRFGPSWSQRLVMAKWVISGAAVMEVAGERLRFGPGQVAIYLPTIPHRFWALEAVNEMCWFSTDGPYAEQLVLELGLRPGVYTVPPPSRERLQELAASLADPSAPARRRASLLAIAEWHRLADAIGVQPRPSHVGRTTEIIAQEFSDPELSAESIARRVGYHRGSLSRMFRRETGETIIGHLTRVRLREAEALLAHTDEPVIAIAQQCGFRDAAYFCRWFRKHTGNTPGRRRLTSREGS
jgi:AraC-like DNA-binding protein